MKHKLFILLLAIVASAGTLWASDTKVDGIWYDFDSNTEEASVTYRGSDRSSYSNGYSGAVTIPPSVTYNNVTYKVTSIGDWAFYDCIGLTSITLPNSVTGIGEHAFYGCTGLTSITIPNSVTGIGDWAFYGCKALTSITIPNSVTGIGDWTFYGCKALTSITIPNSVTGIGNEAFRNCTGLTSVTIGNSVTSIGNSAFYGCTGLTSVTIGNSVTSIGNSAFYGCTGLTSITIPNSVTGIGDWAFYGCTGLTSITIPNGVTSIGERAFRNCTGLTSITIPNSVTSIGEFAFSGCTGLTSITIPNSVMTIGNYAFYGCTGLTSITLPNSVTGIGEHAFYGCTGLTSITIPNSVTGIGDWAFYGCTGLTSVTIGNGVTSIGEFAFSGCTGLTSVTIGNSVYSIGVGAFWGCESLTSVAIGNGVTSIGNSAFYGCTGLTYPVYNAHCFAYMPTSYSGAYTIPDGIKQIAGSAFSGCTGLTSITIPNSVTGIGNEAFRNCTSLTSITIPNSVTGIGNEAFRNCTGLTSITIPNSVTSIGDDAFYGCTGLTSITIPNSVTSIGVGAFYGCSSLTAIYVPCGELERFQTMLKEYAAKVQYPSVSYTITKKAEHGTISTTRTEFIVCDDEHPVTCTAVPNYGYHFVRWADGNTDNPRTIELTQDTTLMAEFTKNTYSVVVQSSSYERGIVTDNISALYLDIVEISATPNYGYHFDHWNDGNTSNPRTITITEDKTYTATFAKNIYAIAKITNSEHGTIIGNSQAEYLDVVTLDATPNNGYYFVRWADGNTDNPRTIELTQDTTMEAIFDYLLDGKCGKDNALTWKFNPSSMALDITGKGALSENYTYGTCIESVTIGNEVTVIGQNAFKNCTNLTSVTIPKSVKTIGEDAFDGCDKISEIRFDGTLNYWCAKSWIPIEISSEYDLYIVDKKITALVVPNGVTMMKEYAFAGCKSLTSVLFPESVTSIESSAFKNCTSLAYAIIPSSVNTIKSDAFSGCSSLKSVTCYRTTPPELSQDAFANIPSECVLYVLEQSLFVYMNDATWDSSFREILPIGAVQDYNATDDVTVTPSENTADVVWPQTANAATYELVIKDKNGNVICTLVFNANGQLTQIAFAAPSRINAPAQAQAAGFAFTVTGLESGMTYTYTLTARNQAGNILNVNTGSFYTTSQTALEDIADDAASGTQGPTALEDIADDAASASGAQKVMIDGQIYILRDGKAYTVTGAEVK